MRLPGCAGNGALVKLLLILAVMAAVSAPLRATLVSEQEPNNDLDTANPVQCGDTVYAALLNPPADLDHYRFFVWDRDSIIVTTIPCQGSNANTFMVLYDDRDSVLAVDDNSGPGWYSTIHYGACYSGEYVLRVMRITSYPDSLYSLVIGCPARVPEAYDLCTTPRIVPSLPYFNEGSTLGATSQCGTAAPDVFYRFHNPVAGNLWLTVCSDEFDARVQLLGGCCSNYLDDSNTGCNLGAVLFTFNAAAGDYYVIVEGQSALDAGNFTLEIAPELPPCPAPGPLILTTIGGYPTLDWPELAAPNYYVVWYSNSANGVYDHLGITFFTYFVDSTGYTGPRRFYKVTSVCPW